MKPDIYVRIELSMAMYVMLSWFPFLLLTDTVTGWPFRRFPWTIGHCLLSSDILAFLLLWYDLNHVLDRTLDIFWTFS